MLKTKSFWRGSAGERADEKSVQSVSYLEDLFGRAKKRKNRRSVPWHLLDTQSSGSNLRLAPHTKPRIPQDPHEGDDVQRVDLSLEDRSNLTDLARRELSEVGKAREAPLRVLLVEELIAVCRDQNDVICM